MFNSLCYLDYLDRIYFVDSDEQLDWNMMFIHFVDSHISENYNQMCLPKYYKKMYISAMTVCYYFRFDNLVFVDPYSLILQLFMDSAIRTRDILACMYLSSGQNVSMHDSEPLLIITLRCVLKRHIKATASPLATQKALLRSYTYFDKPYIRAYRSNST